MIIKPNKAFNDLPLLPPKESLVETISILKQESKSAVALAELKGLTNTLPNPNILINVVILKEAQASSGIENVITTQDKLYQALYAKSAKPDAATKEVLRNREALLMGTLLIKEKGFLNTNGIIAIQKELEENNAGLRRLPGTALVNDLTNEVIYTPPDNFYTISDYERDFVRQNLSNYQYEGQVFYAYDNNSSGDHEALYRFFNTATGTHFYTASVVERDSVVANLSSFKYEGIGFYIE